MAGQYQPPDLSRSFLREKPPRSEAPQGCIRPRPCTIVRPSEWRLPTQLVRVYREGTIGRYRDDMNLPRRRQHRRLAPAPQEYDPNRRRTRDRCLLSTISPLANRATKPIAKDR